MAYKMFDLSRGDSMSHNECKPARQKQDCADERKLTETFSGYGMVSSQNETTLQNIATKDCASEVIETSLLKAKHFGQEQLLTFVQERPISDPGQTGIKSI